jgi:hypothetical protein
MSWYQLHRCVYDWVRAGEVSDQSDGDGREHFDSSRYELTAQEREAFESGDVAALYRQNLHQVLLNRYCPVAGFETER